jgi:tetratricopeptide (TPR) repeat protein
MSNQHRPLSRWQLFAFAVALLVCSGGHSASAQVPNPNLATADSRIESSPNPKTNRNHASHRAPDTRKPSASSERQPPEVIVLDKKQDDIEGAIQAGNDARDANDYGRAISSYEKAENLNEREYRAHYGLGNVYADLHCNDSAIKAYIDALRLKGDYREALLALGYAYSAKERYDDAETQFNEVLKTAPHDPEALMGIGSLHTKRGKYAEAIAQFQVISNDASVEVKHRAAAQIGLGRIYDKQLKYQEAINHYQEAIKLKPDLATAYLSLGTAQVSAAFSNLPGFENVKELNEQDLQALRTAARQGANNIEKAKEDKDHPFNHPVVYALLAQALAYQSRYQAATVAVDEYFSEIKSLEEQTAKQSISCGEGFEFLKADGDWERGNIAYIEALFEIDGQRRIELLIQANQQFIHATETKQDYVPAYTMSSVIYSRLGKYQESLDQDSKALRYETDVLNRSRLHRSIGAAYSLMGRQEEALKNIQEAIKLNPTDPFCYESLASIYVRENKLEETFTLLKKASDLRVEQGTKSTDSGPYYYLGVTYSIRFMKNKAESDFNEAVRLIKAAIEISPKNSKYYQGLGITYEKHSNADEAMTAYLKAVEYDPKDIFNYFHMADVYADLRHNDDAALERLNKALEIDAKSAEAHWRLAQVYFRKKDNPEAIKLLLKTIELDPKYLQAYVDLALIYKSEKNYPDAIKYLTSAVGVAPTDYYPKKELAKVYEDQGKNEDAIHCYEQAVSLLSADDLSARSLYLGRIARLRGQYAEAIEYFRKLNFPEGPGQMYYDIGMTYIARKNKRAALEQYQQLVQLKSPLAEDLLRRINEMK